MSDINITKFLLDLEDENLIPDENSCMGYVSLPNGITAKLLKLKSTTPFVVCPEGTVKIFANSILYRLGTGR